MAKIQAKMTWVQKMLPREAKISRRSPTHLYQVGLSWGGHSIRHLGVRGSLVKGPGTTTSLELLPWLPGTLCILDGHCAGASVAWLEQ